MKLAGNLTFKKAGTIAKALADGPENIGWTPSYRSPEQARGDAHRPLQLRRDPYEMEPAARFPEAPARSSSPPFSSPPDSNKSWPRRLEKDRDLRYQHAADICADVKPLRHTDTNRSRCTTPNRDCSQDCTATGQRAREPIAMGRSRFELLPCTDCTSPILGRSRQTPTMRR